MSSRLSSSWYVPFITFQRYAYGGHQEVPILGKHIPELVQFLLQCGANRNFDSELRVLALNALNWTVQ